MAEDDTQRPEPVVAPSGPTARVADSYGTNPNEHKPSQDPWVAEEADAKQAETGGVPVVAVEEESSPGSSSSTSPSSEPSSKPTNPTVPGKPARGAGNPSTPAPKAGSTARSTGSGKSGS